MFNGAINNNTEDSGTPCNKCGTTYIFINTGCCVSCSRKNVRKQQNKKTNMEYINKRRKLMKEKELRKINKDFYFED